MSHFYMSTESDCGKTLATRRGKKQMRTHLRSWDCGIEVVCYKGENQNLFDVYITGGSNKKRSSKLMVQILERFDTPLVEIRHQCSKKTEVIE